MQLHPVTRLCYAGGKRRRWLPLGLIFIGLAASAGPLAWRLGPTAWNGLKSWHEQRQWETCTVSADQIVLDTGGKTVTDSRMLGWGRSFPGYRPPERRSFTKLKPVFDSMGTIFLHKMRSRSGHDLLVCVDVYADEAASPRERMVLFDSNVYTLDRAPRHEGCKYGCDVWPVNCGLNDRLRFFAGQADPDDASHFTVRYDWNGVGGTIDGYLNDEDLFDWVPDRGINRLCPSVRGLVDMGHDTPSHKDGSVGGEMRRGMRRGSGILLACRMPSG